MGSHVSCWYRQLFELSLNGFRRLCNGTNGPASPGTALPLLERQLALGRVLLPYLQSSPTPTPVLCILLLMFSKLWELTQNFSVSNYTREFSPPLCPAWTFLSLSDLVINDARCSGAAQRSVLAAALRRSPGAAHQPPVLPDKGLSGKVAQLLGGMFSTTRISRNPQRWKMFHFLVRQLQVLNTPEMRPSLFWPSCETRKKNLY